MYFIKRISYNRILLIIPAVQTQAGWSFSEDVNFLASGYNEPASGNTGSGIYLGNLIYILYLAYKKFAMQIII